MARNQYAGTCYQCGMRVEPGTGHFEKIPYSRNWRVKHANVPGHGRITCTMAKDILQDQKAAAKQMAKEKEK